MELCADYILSEFKSYGLQAQAHEFTVDGFDYTFRNIEASTKEEGPEFLIVSHYDTARHAPGANDNGSAIAVMLEAARAISLSEPSTPVRFISFNLEELNPAKTQQRDELALSLGIHDSSGRYTSWQTTKVIERFSNLYFKYCTTEPSYVEAAVKATDEMDDDLTESQRKYAEGIRSFSEGITCTNWPGKVSLMGSSAWVHDALQRGDQVKGVLCLETMGYTSNLKHSQRLPEGMTPEMFETYGTASDLVTGDFIFAFGDSNSKDLNTQFCMQCKHDSVRLPYASFQVDITYDEAAHGMRDLLRSDHAPFWKANIPALLLTDGANFRYPYYHTRADTVDKLDFDFLAKICRAAVATALSH